MKLLMLGIESHDHDEIAAISKGTLLVNRDYHNWNVISPWVEYKTIWRLFMQNISKPPN
jgi:hypothetical protein